MLLVKILQFLRNLRDNWFYKIKPIRKIVVKHRRKNDDFRNGIVRPYFRKHVKICQDLMGKKRLDEREYLQYFFSRYKITLYLGLVDNATDYIDYTSEQTQLYNDKNKRQNKISHKLPFSGDWSQRDDRKRQMLLRQIIEKENELKPLLNQLNPSEEYFALFSENYTPSPKPPPAPSTTTIGCLDEEQTDEFWKLCNLRIFKHCTKSEFISSFQIENDFTLNYTTKSALYAFCPFIEKSSLYAYCDKELILNKILERFEIKKEDYSKNAIRKPNINHSEKEKEIYQSLHDFFVSYKLI